MLNVNVIHRPMSGRYDMFRLQQSYAREVGIRVTVLLQPDLLFDEALLAELTADSATWGDELGLWFSDLDSDIVHEWTGTHENFLWLMTTEQKRTVIERSVARFEAVTGRRPTCAGSYHLDAVSIDLLRELCPEIGTVVAGCFEEGVKVFHGCNNSWYLFNEGMPWGPWYPSRHDSLVPAASDADWAGVVAVPHLSRDPALSYLNRNDFYATHPNNLQRAMANEGRDCPYAYNLVDLYRMQEELNGDSYINVHVGPGWLQGNPNVQDPDDVSQGLYRDFLEYLAGLRDGGQARVLTLSEYGAWHRENVRIGATEGFLAKDVLYGSGRHLFWYVGPDLRVLFDGATGASIGDLRPYVSRERRWTGADSPQLAMGSVPYLIQSIYRSGVSHHLHAGSRSTLLLEHAGRQCDVGEAETRVEDVVRDGDQLTVTFTPARFAFDDGLSGEIRTRYRLDGTGRIETRRELVAVSDPDAELTAVEHLRLAPGTTEYPEPLHEVTLGLEGTDRQLRYAYGSRTLDSAEATGAWATFPQTQTRAVLRPRTPAASCTAGEGFLFEPFVTLETRTPLVAGTPVETDLILERAS